MSRWIFVIATFGIVGAFLFSASIIAGRDKPTVIFISECSCQGNHGVARWRAKTDAAEPPKTSKDIKPITPSEIYEWKGPGGNLPTGAGRIVAENQWYAVTGRLKKVKAEDDGDVHMVLANANDNKPGQVIIEVPLGSRWCELRKMIFSWTDVVFPFPTAEAQFRLVRNHVITAVGRAFYDIDHSGDDTTNNRRDYDKKLAVWEIHPVMKIEVMNEAPTPPVSSPQPQSAPALAPTPTVGPSKPPPSATPIPTVQAKEFATITKAVTIQIPYGRMVLSPGIKLEVISRTTEVVTVRYMDSNYPIPIGSTNLR